MALEICIWRYFFQNLKCLCHFWSRCEYCFSGIVKNNSKSPGFVEPLEGHFMFHFTKWHVSGSKSIHISTFATPSFVKFDYLCISAQCNVLSIKTKLTKWDALVTGQAWRANLDPRFIRPWGRMNKVVELYTLSHLIYITLEK